MTNKLFIILLAFFLVHIFLCDSSYAGTYKNTNRQASKQPAIYSDSVVVYDEAFDRVILQKNPKGIKSIASITKLMTAMVVLDANQPLDEEITITNQDLDTHKGTHSRLTIGTSLSRSELLRLALMSSENRAASALARAYPGGKKACIRAMNMKARKLDMKHTRFVDPTGLYEENVSTAVDLIKLVEASYNYPLIRIYTTEISCDVPVGNRYKRVEKYNNTNLLVRKESWDIKISKTGFIKEAGRCLVMMSNINNRPYIIVLLDSAGTQTRIGDANRIKKWLEKNKFQYMAGQKHSSGGV